ncbi:maestro heat-like repeat-containing protein family member 2B [Columba livia]|uniref:maestro heat-like repeat-containing protein family member 2B n=1 Tax=Columba livia TaxID=8932 RepID=UPI0031BBC4D3
MRGSLGSPRASTVAVQLLSALCGPQERGPPRSPSCCSTWQVKCGWEERLERREGQLPSSHTVGISHGQCDLPHHECSGSDKHPWAPSCVCGLARALAQALVGPFQPDGLGFLGGLTAEETTGLFFGVSLSSSRAFASSCFLGRAESSLDSAEWEQHVLKFLRASLKLIEDETWSVGLSQQLSRQLGSSAPGSWQKLFLYKALGTALAGCRDLSHVQGQVLRFLQDTDSAELSETQGMISVVSHAAETHFNLVLDTVTAFTRDRFYETSTGWKAQLPQGTERPQATRAALMCVYSGIALRAPREQLLARVDREIMGTILQLSRVTQREMQLKLALVQSVTEVSSAIQTVGDAGSFELSSKQEVTQTLLDWIKEEPADSLVYGVFQALEELSKLRPALSREENRSLLAVCCQAVLSSPSFLLNGENICEAPARTAAEW